MSDTTNTGGPERAKRTGPGQFMKEVRVELRRVAWPSRQEVAQYSLIVLAVTLVLGAIIFGLDQLFGQIVFWIFG
ncbi:preprotein translocase subunit SecE [Euzebya rosea]|uniref:preprotein translocase subunit SecE n=1 Tax=Euzebya rosea TaxID=2052804 RepID=UPI0013009CFB|nr:preprotein translocase subunit SecE [Euzebya rosea]